MKKRHVISSFLFALSVVILLLSGLGANNWPVGVLLLLVFLLAGIFFYRRGK
jgi:hypothetical protein